MGGRVVGVRVVGRAAGARVYFGVAGFPVGRDEGRKVSLDAHDVHRAQPGETLVLRYLVVLHGGDAEEAGIDRRWTIWTEEKSR